MIEAVDEWSAILVGTSTRWEQSLFESPRRGELRTLLVQCGLLSMEQVDLGYADGLAGYIEWAYFEGRSPVLDEVTVSGCLSFERLTMEVVRFVVEVRESFSGDDGNLPPLDDRTWPDYYPPF